MRTYAEMHRHYRELRDREVLIELLHQAIRERDEARAELEQLRADFENDDRIRYFQPIPPRGH